MDLYDGTALDAKRFFIFGISQTSAIDIIFFPESLVIDALNAKISHLH
jgi:hypothetical protein